MKAAAEQPWWRSAEDDAEWMLTFLDRAEARYSSVDIHSPSNEEVEAWRKVANDRGLPVTVDTLYVKSGDETRTVRTVTIGGSLAKARVTLYLHEEAA